MPVYSHSRNLDAKERIGSKLLIDHLEAVKKIAIQHFSKRVRISDSEQEVTQLLEMVCLFHDLGKGTRFFQDYLLNPDCDYGKLKNHSNIGAHTIFNVLKTDPEKALIAFYLIKLHHSNLLNFNQVISPNNWRERRLEEEGIFQRQKNSLVEQCNEIEKIYRNLSFDAIDFVPATELNKTYRNSFHKNPDICRYFKINYLFSLLIEADKLDASDTSVYQKRPIDSLSVDNRLGKPIYPDKDLKLLSQNELRNYVREQVNQNLLRSDILQRKIFTLAGPTGIGKTLTSLDFVLKLRNKMEKEEGYLPQIIYGLPFINIIEQALAEYEKTVNGANIIGHYQYADIFGREATDETNYNKMKMAWDTWQSDIVITSFVQLFETLIGNRNRLLKKFNHFADSIIILDEVQTLAIDKLPVIGAALYYLCKYLNARVLIMTATQPELFQLMERELSIDITEPDCQPLNLLENDDEVFACFNRTKIVPNVDTVMSNVDFLNFFEKKWNTSQSCIIVVNKVSRSIEVFSLLREKYKTDESIHLYYLSTNITPKQRQQRINEIKVNLKSKTCILVSTQVVEAGVDLDFDMGFRDLGPIDSIVQVAGRINRENDENRKGAPLFIIDFGDCKRIYGSSTYYKAKASLGNGIIPEAKFKPMVEKYFEEVTDQSQTGFEISKAVFNAMKELRYANPQKSESLKKTVSDFKIIDNSHKGVSVFVELPEDSDGTEARIAYQQMIDGDLIRQEFEKEYKRAFNQRIIAVPSYLENVGQLSMLTDDILWIQPEVAKYYYNQNTGFIRDTSQVAEEDFFF